MRDGERPSLVMTECCRPLADAPGVPFFPLALPVLGRLSCVGDVRVDRGFFADEDEPRGVLFALPPARPPRPFTLGSNSDALRSRLLEACLAPAPDDEEGEARWELRRGDGEWVGRLRALPPFLPDFDGIARPVPSSPDCAGSTGVTSIAMRSAFGCSGGGGEDEWCEREERLEAREALREEGFFFSG
jgi:hypothetical protein